ncbi:MAG TPA: lipopolysaccharide heptosyltransferase I [Nitrospiria bacterium]|nr:lipopolysaccharide heptosyltransferase I [Nitrospiria bacterium]
MSSDDARVELGPAPRIAVVKLGALGDVVYAFPLVTALKGRWPGARVTWIVEARLADLPRLHPGVDAVVTVDTRGWRAALRRGGWRAAWREFRAFQRSVDGRFDAAVDAQGLVKSGVVAWLTRAPIRVGFAAQDCRERLNASFMTHHAARVGPVHAVVKNRGLAAVLGAESATARFEIRPGTDDEAWADAWLERHAPGRPARLITLHPGAGHPGKRWPLDRWVALADRLGDRGWRVVLVAGPDERDAVTATALVATPPTVGALAALLRRAEIVVGGDTGPVHLAAALGRRIVGLYGPSDPATAAPVGAGHRLIKHPCACGWTPGPTFNRRCPERFACMRAIEVEEAADAVEKQLAGQHA